MYVYTLNLHKICTTCTIFFCVFVRVILHIAFSLSPVSPLKWGMPEATLKTGVPKPQNASWDEILEGECQRHFGRTAQCWALVRAKTSQLLELYVDLRAVQ